MQPLTQNDDYSFLEDEQIKVNQSAKNQQNSSLSVSDQNEEDDYSFLEDKPTGFDSSEKGSSENRLRKKSLAGTVIRGGYNAATAVPELLELVKKVVDYPPYAVARAFNKKEDLDSRGVVSPFEKSSYTSKLTEMLEKQGVLQESSLGQDKEGFIEAATQGAAFGAPAGPIGSLVGAGLALVGEGVSQITGSPLLGAAAEIALGFGPSAGKKLKDIAKQSKNRKAKIENAPKELKQLGSQLENKMAEAFEAFKSSKVHVDPDNLREFKQFDPTTLQGPTANIVERNLANLDPSGMPSFQRKAKIQEAADLAYRETNSRISSQYEQIAKDQGDLQVSPEIMDEASKTFKKIRKGLSKSLIRSPEERASQNSLKGLEKAFRTEKPKESLEMFLFDLDGLLGSQDKKPKKITLDNLLKTNISLGSMINYETIEPSIKNLYLKPAKRANEALIKKVLLSNGAREDYFKFANTQKEYFQMVKDFNSPDIKNLRKTPTPSSITAISKPENLETMKKVTNPSVHPLLEAEYINSTAPSLKTNSISYADAQKEAKAVLSDEGFRSWKNIVKERTQPKYADALAQDNLKIGQEVIDSIVTGKPPQDLLNRMKNPQDYKRFKEAFNKKNTNSEIWKTLEGMFIDQTFGSLEKNGTLDVNQLQKLASDKNTLKVVGEIAGPESVKYIENMDSIASNIAKTIKSEKEAIELVKSLKNDNVLSVPAMYAMHLLYPKVLTQYVGGKIGINTLKNFFSDPKNRAAIKQLAKPDLSRNSVAKLMNSIKATSLRNKKGGAKSAGNEIAESNLDDFDFLEN